MDKNQHCYICNCSLPQQSPPSFTCNHTQCTSCLANYLLRSEFKTFSSSFSIEGTVRFKRSNALQEA